MTRFSKTLIGVHRRLNLRSQPALCDPFFLFFELSKVNNFLSRRRSTALLRSSIGLTLLIFLAAGCRQTAPTPTRTSTRPTSSSQSRAPRSSSTQNGESRSGGASSSEGNLLLGNPTKAGRAADNFLLEHEQYSMSYNRSKGGPNWVAWHSDASNLGEVERGKFAPDPDLPPDSQIRPTDYKGSGFDRGHVCPSGDRTATREANNQTFYMSNMLPQTASLNQHVWADLENYLRDQIRDGNEVYEIAGGAGSAGTIAGGKVNIPQICWKVAIILPEGSGDLRRIGAKTRILAVGMPNVDDKRLETGDWRSYLTTLSKIESATKLDLLSALPASVEKALASRVDSGN